MLLLLVLLLLVLLLLVRLLLLLSALLLEDVAADAATLCEHLRLVLQEDLQSCSCLGTDDAATLCEDLRQVTEMSRPAATETANLWGSLLSCPAATETATIDSSQERSDMRDRCRGSQSENKA